MEKPSKLNLPPTKRQLEVLECIKSHIRNHGEVPTMLAVSEAMGFKSSNSANLHIKALRKKGFVEQRSNYPTGWREKVKTLAQLDYDVDRCECGNFLPCDRESGPGARPMHPDWVRSLRDHLNHVRDERQPRDNP